MVFMGLVVVLCCVLAAQILERRFESHELRHKADLIAAALEASAEMYASAPEFMAFVERLGRHTSGLADVALIDLEQGRVVAATVDPWVGRRTGSIPVLHAAGQMEEWESADGLTRMYAIPVQVDNRSLARSHRRSLLAVIAIDGSALASAGRDLQATLWLVAGLGGLGLLGGFFGLVQRRVLNPIRQIHRALNSGPGAHRRMPELFPDEIGELARVLDSAFSELSESHNELQLLSRALDTTSNEVYILDGLTDRVLRANPQALTNLGYSAEEITSMTVGDVSPDYRNPEVRNEFLKQLRARSEITFRYQHRRKNGSLYPFEFSATLVREGDDFTLLVIGNDVTERVAQEQALRDSEERMKLAMQGSNDGLFDYDLERGTIYISGKMHVWLGLPEGHHSVDRFVETVHPQDRERVFEDIRSAARTSQEFNVEYRIASDTASHRWLQVRGRTVARDGLVQRLSGFATDITRRKVAENLLHNTVARLGAVLETVADGIITLNQEGMVCTVNPAALSMLGVAKEAFAGMPMVDCLEQLEGTEPDGSVAWSRMADGQVRACTVAVGAHRFAAEIAVSEIDTLSDERFTVVLRNVEAQRRHETELRKAMEKAQAATRAKGEFLATMSHEIRTPMNGVLGMTQLLLDMNLNNDQRETAQIILSSGEALLTLINDILDFSKIEAGKLELESIPFDFRAALREVMELLSANARRKDLDLYVDYPDDVPFAFAGDVGRLRQILLNLVGNAVKFTRAGHVLVSVRAAAPVDGIADLSVSVRDTGSGISFEVQRQLFDAFTQADASTTRRYGGTGLGLAICKQLVELMGGAIGVRSEPGDGAEFWFTIALPLATQAVDSAEVDVQRLSGKRLLAVDDNDVGLSIVKQMGESFGMHVQATSDPLKVLYLMDRACGEGEPFDVVALDYNMPVVDGLTVATNIRDDNRFDQARIVLLTSSELKSPSGLDGYALKPVMRAGFARLLLKSLYDDGERTTRNSDQSVGPVVSGTRVLVAEDNPVNQRVAVRMLEKLGCRVDVAANGREAVDMWSQFSYGLIFMDCQMPELDGLAATEEIRRQERSAQRNRTPIIAMTANAMASDQQDCLDSGMDDYAAKPIKISLLSELVIKWAAAPSLH